MVHPATTYRSNAYLRRAQSACRVVVRKDQHDDEANAKSNEIPIPFMVQIQREPNLDTPT